MTPPTVSLEPIPPTRLDPVVRRLEAAGLPADDVGSTPATFYLATDGERPLGVGGLERYGTDGLLRSVVVDESHRGRGYGRALCAALEAEARQAGVTELYLLTTTVRAFFAACGYATVDRADVPAPVRASPQFAEICPTSATCMTKAL